MSKEEILDYFKDINHAYNDCTKYDTLKRMLDELQDPLADATKYFNTIYKLSQTLDVSYDFIDEKIKEMVPAFKKPSISDDGTLTVYVEDGKKVSRVLVCGDNHFGGLYYPE